MKKIAIIGCGHGGQALAGHMASLGSTIHLYAHPQHLGGVEAIRKAGKITCTGAVSEEGSIDLCTTDIGEAISGVDVIFICLPVTAHDAIFRDMLPLLKEGQAVINLSAHFSGLFQNDMMHEYGKSDGILIGDVTSFPYACRSVTHGVAKIIAIKRKVGLAARSIQTANQIKMMIQDFFPSELEVKSSFIEIGLYDPSGITHPPIAVFNAGRIGNGEEFYFYREGTSESTAFYLESLDRDRIEIGKRLGLSIPTYPAVMNEYYGFNHTKIIDFFKGSPVHNQEKLCPKSLNHRYITEDVPYSLVPWYTLGRCLGYDSKAMRNIIEICSILHSRDYLTEGRNITQAHVSEILPVLRLCG